MTASSTTQAPGRVSAGPPGGGRDVLLNISKRSGAVVAAGAGKDTPLEPIGGVHRPARGGAVGDVRVNTLKPAAARHAGDGPIAVHPEDRKDRNVLADLYLENNRCPKESVR